MATRPANVPETVRRLTKELYRRLARGEIAALEVIHARHGSARGIAVERRPIFPLDLEAFVARPGRTPPLSHLPPARLLELLTEEYVFALLTEAALESIAAENAARFASMEAAHENVGKKLDELHQTARRVRQAEITTELLDVVTGAEALASARS